MSIWLDGNFWSSHFERLFVPQVNNFCDVLLKRVLPTFAKIEQEADGVAEDEFKRLGSMPGDSETDMGSLSEQAQEAGVAHYDALESVRQTIINLSTAALFHIFEQQLLFFHRRQVLHPAEENDISKIRTDELKRRLLSGGIDIESLQSWKDIYELQLIANSVKHAEGRSSEELQGLRKDLFTHPVLRNEEVPWPDLDARVYLPLAGQDIYLTTADLEKYRSAIVLFWQEFGEAIRKHSEKRM